MAKCKGFIVRSNGKNFVLRDADVHKAIEFRNDLRKRKNHKGKTALVIAAWIYIEAGRILWEQRYV